MANQHLYYVRDKSNLYITAMTIKLIHTQIASQRNWRCIVDSYFLGLQYLEDILFHASKVEINVV